MLHLVKHIMVFFVLPLLLFILLRFRLFHLVHLQILLQHLLLYLLLSLHLSSPLPIQVGSLLHLCLDNSLLLLSQHLVDQLLGCLIDWLTVTTFLVSSIAFNWLRIDDFVLVFLVPFPLVGLHLIAFIRLILHLEDVLDAPVQVSLVLLEENGAQDFIIVVLEHLFQSAYLRILLR